jgi:hypothetical protein
VPCFEAVLKPVVDAHQDATLESLILFEHID